MRFLALMLLALVWAATANAQANDNRHTEARAALVIGNAGYQNGVLRNPVNDARAVAAGLEKLGFKVLLRENLDREGMHQSIGEFNKLLKQGGVGLFYYAGHGMQINGKNFLIPVDADIQHEDDVEFRGMDTNFVLSRMDAARTRVNLIVLDACRNNPFTRNTRSANLGLAQMDAPKGTLIAFSTAPGSLARDVGIGENGVYTHHLVEKLLMPAVAVEQVFKEVRIAVAKETHDKQIPWESSSLMGDFYFVPPAAASLPARLATPDKPVPVTIPLVTPAVPPAAVVAPADDKPVKLAQPARDYNREGYEIEARAQAMTRDELPEFEARAQRGDAVSQTTLGWAYLLGKGEIDGRGIPRSNQKMLKWTKAAVKQGHPVAQNNLGVIYMYGTGVKLDYRQARANFKLAADQGYVAAQSNLMRVNTLLTGDPDAKVFKDMVNNIQHQLEQPVQ